MGNDNSVGILVSILEPLISDLDEKKRILSDQSNELETISRLIAYTKNDPKMIGIYADQNVILDNLDNMNCRKEDYDASCYLLKSDSEQVKKLPQYAKACDLVKNIVGYFKQRKAELLIKIVELTSYCEEKEIMKNYYDIFTNPNPQVDNISEFKDLLKSQELKDEDIINIMYDTIKNNITSYGKKNK